MMYDFENVGTGEVAGLEFPMAEVPGIGDVWTDTEGVRWKRLPGRPLSHVMSEGRCVSEQAAPWQPGARDYDRDPKSQTYGQPRFANRREQREFCDRNGLIWNP